VIPVLVRKGLIRRLLVAALIGMALAPTLTACGKRGLPAPPHPEENTYPRVYPRA
jgi:predicted small lipoprotein YifL